ncbi:MAG: periplasmic heavy metal sensor [Verrucomicrobia bacterium]|nr:periplasmic heavy metal sensor [Verrucomicrobiota bacterium]
MQRCSFLPHRFLTAALLAACLGTSALSAAEKPAAAPPPGRGRPDAPRLGQNMLDEKQRLLLQEAMLDHRDELRRLNDRMQAAQRELVKAVFQEKPDQNAIRAKAEAAAQAQVELTVLRAKIAAVLAPTLTPEQREQFENSPFALMMLGSGMRGPLGRTDFGRGEPRRAGDAGRPRGLRSPEGDRPPR